MHLISLPCTRTAPLAFETRTRRQSNRFLFCLEIRIKKTRTILSKQRGWKPSAVTEQLCSWACGGCSGSCCGSSGISWPPRDALQIPSSQPLSLVLLVTSPAEVSGVGLAEQGRPCGIPLLSLPGVSRCNPQNVNLEGREKQTMF